MTTDRPDEELPLGENELLDRRSGKDRRSGRDRRRGGRRHRQQDIDNERRGGRDRRKRQRRSGLERRIFTDARYKKPRRRKAADTVYSADDEAQVRLITSRLGYTVKCPVCEGGFTLGPRQRRGGEVVRQVSCIDCGRGTVVTNCLLARVMAITRVEVMRAMLRDVLASVGHEVVFPPHTGAALDLFREAPADVVLMDAFALQEMDGPEFIRRVRTEFPESPIIVLAPRPSYRAADPSATAIQLGAAQVLRMPFAREELLRTVRTALG